MKNSLSKCLFVLVAASLLATPCFAADDDPGDPNIFSHKDKDPDKAKDKKSPKQMVSSSVKASETPIPRIWIGLTGSYTPLRLMSANTTGFQNPTTLETINATRSQGQVGGGLTVNARILRNYWLSVGAIYRFTGYDWMYGSNDVYGDGYVERSRIRLIDIPAMIRYTGRKWNPSKYTFYEIGATYRDVFSRTTTTNWANTTTASFVGPALSSGTNYRRTTIGAVAGAGLIAKDDFGIIVSPEVRYTRWMGETLSNSVLTTQRNQLEITVSFGF